MNKVKVMIIVLMIIIVISFSLLVLVTVFTGQVGDTPSYKSVSRCDEYAEYIALEKGLEKVHSCEQREVEIEGQKYYFVSLSYGPAMDCPAGCFYTNEEFIIKEDKSEQYPFYSIIDKEQTIRDTITYLRPANSRGAISNRITSKFEDYNFFPIGKFGASIVIIDGEAGWKITSQEYFGNEFIFRTGQERTFAAGGWDVTHIENTINNLEEAQEAIRTSDQSKCKDFEYVSGSKEKWHGQWRFKVDIICNHDVSFYSYGKEYFKRDFTVNIVSSGYIIDG